MAIRLTVEDNTSALLTADQNDATTLSADAATVVAIDNYNDLRNKPQIEGVELAGNKTLNDLGAYTDDQVDALLSAKANISDIPTVPTKVSDFTNDAGYIDSSALPTKVSDLTNDSGFITGYTETDPIFTASAAHGISSSDISNWNGKSDFSGSYNDLTDKPTIPTVPSNVSAFTNDAGYITGMTILSYGSSTWNDFITAYNAKKVVYCRASSNSDPASGSQTRLAFMAYVDNATTPTSVEFQYYRSVSSHSASQQGDQVYVYKLTNANAWSVTVREAYTKIATGTGLSNSYNNGTLTVSLGTSIPSKTSDLTNDSGFISTETDPTVPSWAKEESKPSYTATEVGALPTAEKSMLFWGQVDSTSTNTAFTAQIPGITEYKDGLTVILKNGVVTSASGFTININGLGAKHAYSNMAAATAETTLFNINYTMMFVYDSTRVEGGGWILYRGYNANDNTIGYQVRTNSMTLPMKSITYRYRLLFTSADREHFVPATNSTSTNATASRTVCQDPIDPFGEIRYYGTTASVAAGSRPAATALWQQYVLSLGYSFNRTGAALTLTSWKPLYVKCAPQTDGSAIIDSTTPYVQDLPNTEDGKIYIYLGIAYSATNIELVANHPVYWYKDGQIRPYTNAVSSVGGLLVTVTDDGAGTYTANKTAGEIKNVLDVGGSVVMKIGYYYEPLTGAEIQNNRYDFFAKSFGSSPLTCNSLDDYPSRYSDN